MTSVARSGVVTLALGLAFLSAVASSAMQSFKQMPDGKQWTTENLNVKTDQSYCYEDAEPNCRRYGRLYTWESAQRACQSLGDGWRLPTNEEWQQLARHYGGLLEDSNESSAAAAKALRVGGGANFNALLAGNRSADGKYERLNAHGLYWTASQSDSATAWLYNFGGLGLSRHRGGVKLMAVSVRCVKD